MRWISRLVAALALLALVLVALALVLPRLPGVQRWLAVQVATWTGPSVRIDRAALSLLPLPAIRLEGVRLVDPQDAAGEPVASSRDVAAAATLTDLLAGRIHVREIAVQTLRVRVERGPDGEYALVRAIREIGGGASPAAAEAASHPPAPGRSLRLPLRVEDVEVAIGDGADPLRVRLETLTGELQQDPADGALRFRFAGAPAGEEDVHLEGSWGGLETPRALRADLRLDAVPGAALFSRPPGGFLTYDLAATVQGEIGEGAQALDALEGTGRLRFSGGTIPSWSLGAAVWDALLAAVPGASKAASYRRTERPSRIDHLRSDVRLARGVLTFSNLAFVSDHLVIAGHGTVTLAGALDARVTVSLTPDGLTQLLVMANLPLPTGPLKTLPPVPMRIRGTVERPVARAEVTALPLHLAGYVLETGVDTLRETGKAVQKGLGRLLRR